MYVDPSANEVPVRCKFGDRRRGVRTGLRQRSRGAHGQRHCTIVRLDHPESSRHDNVALRGNGCTYEPCHPTKHGNQPSRPRPHWDDRGQQRWCCGSWHSGHGRSQRGGQPE